MGTSYYCLNFLCLLGISDWIALFVGVLNASLAYWIVKTIQNKLANKRVLKDHFIIEIKEIRIEYRAFLNNFCLNKIHPHKVIPWFKLINIKIDDLMIFIDAKYKIDKDKLNPYQIVLRELITNNDDFITQYANDKVVLSQNSKAQLIKFQQDHNHLFNEIIVAINDAS